MAVYSDKLLLEMETGTVVIAIIIIVVVLIIYLCFSVSHHSLKGNTHFANPEA